MSVQCCHYVDSCKECCDEIARNIATLKSRLASAEELTDSYRKHYELKMKELQKYESEAAAMRRLLNDVAWRNGHCTYCNFDATEPKENHICLLKRTIESATDGKEMTEIEIKKEHTRGYEHCVKDQVIPLMNERRDLKNQLKLARETLAWYADRTNYGADDIPSSWAISHSNILKECGQKARACLEKIGGES